MVKPMTPSRLGMGPLHLVLLSVLLCSKWISISAIAPVFGTDVFGQTATILRKEEQVDGSFGSLRETYQAVSAIQTCIKGVPDAPSTCGYLKEAFASSTKDVSAAYFSARAAVILNCVEKGGLVKEAESIMVAAAQNERDLLPLYYAVTGLSFFKRKNLGTGNVDYKSLAPVFNKINALGAGDGWKYTAEDSESSIKASGIALDAIGTLLSLGAIEPSQGLSVKGVVTKLFKRATTSPQGLYFTPSAGDVVHGGGSVVTATGALVKGYISVADALEDSLKISAEKLVAASSFLRNSGVLASPEDIFYQLEALSALDNNNVVVPLVLAGPAVVKANETSNVMVSVTTALGQLPPLVHVKILSATLKGKVICKDKAMEALDNTPLFMADIFDGKAALGQYIMNIQVTSNTPKYSAGGNFLHTMKVIGAVEVDDVVLTVQDSEGTTDSKALLTFGEMTVASLSATHLQKLLISFKITDAAGHPFLAQQVVVELKHESGVVHRYVPEHSGDAYELTLNFLELMAKLFHLSGSYEISLTVGDNAILNSFTWKLGEVELDLPAAPDNAPKPPAIPAPLSSRFGPMAEINHIFRVPEKRPALSVSYSFTALALIPLLLFLAGLATLGLNFKGFPSEGLPFVAAVGFHGGIASILLLYLLFWYQLNLFSTLKWLVILGGATTIPGHYLLSFLANHSSKLKTA